ncbi:bifunctional diguanylate cyclase/phosphodiesterase [Anaerosporobacter sp.]|uniref:bifunctional diguanylate cyclase/phosphodiesterase n=1 Tax=Anaerosporobacter sp. TaxID=1872529 RepID=UPI00286EBB70|nr:EAL domain-containing protein [Anaerosporobacter sp.]
MKSRLNTILIIFSIVPLVIITAITLSFYGKKKQSDHIANLQSNAEFGSKIITNLLHTQETELSLLARQNEIVNLCLYSSGSSSNAISLYQDSQNTLLQKQYLNPYYEMLTIYDRTGNIIRSTNEREQNQAYRTHPIIERINTTNMVTSISLSPGYYNSLTRDCSYIDIGSPIFRSQTNKIIGYLVLTVNASFFNEYLDIFELRTFDFTTLMDRSGNYLFFHVPSKPIQEKNPTFISNFKSTIEENSLLGYSSLGTIYSGSSYAYHLIDDLNWYFVILQNNNFHATYSYAITIVIASIIILLIIILVSSRKIAYSFAYPLLNLRDCMRQAADGNLTVLCNVKTKDEFGELSRSFNKMLHIIKSNYDELSFVHKKLLVKEEQLRSNYEHIEFLAYHDSLTRLPNKAAFYDYLDTTLTSEPSSTQAHAIYFVDLDNFKTVNDTLGHDYGDELLIQTANLLNFFIKDNDLLARAGGDEFLFFKANISSQEEGVNFAKDILKKFKEPININGKYIYISMSIGVSLYPLNGVQYHTLIKNADIAMYRSKDTGKNRLTLFDESMQQEVSRHSEITEILRHAIDNNEIYLEYQPQFDLALERIIGFEALMRIHSPVLGNLSPTEFIPIAEESGMINDLGSWALREACTFNKYLQDNGLPYCIVAVNISTIQLNQNDFVTLVADILKETGLSPQYLELEITESAIVSSIRDAVSILDELQNMGIRISLDDFGTGYSSLNYLTQMPINTLKIDKAFIDKINLNKKDNYVAEAIISLAHNLEVKVVAEGVEDHTQLSLLREKRCDLIQGYLYSKPLKPNDLIHILQIKK